jgi:hypothetical protein
VTSTCLSSFKDGWVNNGAANATHPPIRAAVFFNPENVRMLEHNCTEHYRDQLFLGNQNVGGGGPLGLRTDARDDNGNPIYKDDPLGYFLYIVYKCNFF